MLDPDQVVEPILEQLEAIQAQIGIVQRTMLQWLITENMSDWDDAVQQALLQLEGGQRRMGEVQIGLIRQLAAHKNASRSAAATGSGQSAGPILLASTNPVTNVEPGHHGPADWMDLKQWLTDSGLRITSIRAPSGLDGAEEALAVLLGEHFASIEPFYDILKRHISGTGPRWFPVDDSASEAFKGIYQLGTKLKEHGFLTEFRYIRASKSILFEPVADGRIGNFLTGGWMEHYALYLAQRAVVQALGTWQSDQALLGTSVQLPDGTSTEFDLLVGLPGGKVIWVECKTGGWQKYLTQFRDINHRFLHLPRGQAALVLLDSLPTEAEYSNSELCDMTVLQLAKLSGWLAAAVASAA